MIFRQLFDKHSSTYTYLIADKKAKEALLIDPVKENVEQYITLLRELDLILKVAVDTHVHADHITALGELKELTQCKSVVGLPERVTCASEAMEDGKEFQIGELTLKSIYTPGHTDDSYSLYLIHDHQGHLFTGDTLLIRGTGRTDFQNGDSAQLYDSLMNKLFTLPEDTVVWPGHDYNGMTQSTLKEEKAFNPRLQTKDKEAFQELMANLSLPEPKMIDVAVPANQACGKE